MARKKMRAKPDNIFPEIRMTQQRPNLTPAELRKMLADPDWFRKLDAKDISFATGPILTEKQFKELQARKRATGAPAATVIRPPPPPAENK